MRKKDTVIDTSKKDLLVSELFEKLLKSQNQSLPLKKGNKTIFLRAYSLSGYLHIPDDWFDNFEKSRDAILTEWEELLDNKTKKEKDYHRYIKEHAGILLSRIEGKIVLSKIKYGDNETDFVVIHEGFSRGPSYTFYEIKSPHAKLFNKDESQALQLRKAVDQIRNLDQWLRKYPAEAKKLFPSEKFNGATTSVNYDFKIIIGRRTNDQGINNMKNELAKSLKLPLEIRSFDSLSDDLQIKWPKYPNNQSKFGPEVNGLLSNPFCRAFTHTEWKVFRQNLETCHFYSSNWKKILFMKNEC